MITACGRYLELQLGLLPMSAAAAAACIKKKGIGGQSNANSMFETLSAYIKALITYNHRRTVIILSSLASERALREPRG